MIVEPGMLGWYLLALLNGCFPASALSETCEKGVNSGFEGCLHGSLNLGESFFVSEYVPWMCVDCAW